MSTVLEAREPSARYLDAVEAPLVREFELLAGAPGGVARLRELILTFAVQGRLVGQDARDEPAQELLAQILKRKEALIAAGRLKRDKPQAPIDEAELRFGIPHSWCWTRLGSVTTYGSPTKAGRIEPETWVLDLEDIEKSTGRLLHRARRSERPALSDKNAFEAGDVLYGKLRPYLNKVLVADEPGVCTTELVPFRCYGDWDPRYFKIALSSPIFLDYANARSYGMKMPRLGTEDARRAILPLPPLKEQTRIVARVDELMRLCDALESKGRLEAEQHARLLDTLLGTLTDSSAPERPVSPPPAGTRTAPRGGQVALGSCPAGDLLAANWQRVAEHFDLLLDRPEAVDALEQTILQLAVRGLLVPQDPNDEPACRSLGRSASRHQPNAAAGRRVRQEEVTADETTFVLPGGWTWTRLGALVEMQNGYAFKSDWFRQSGTRLLRNVNIGHGRADWSQTAYIDSDRAKEFEPFRLEAGDVVLTLDRPIISTGLKFAILHQEDLPCLLLQRVARLTPHSVAMSRDFLVLWLESDLFMSAIDPGRSNGVPHISTKQVGSLTVGLPPLPEQARIVARVTELRRLCADLRQRLAASRTTQAHLADALVEQAAA